jgi:hypothetical protein
LLGNDYDRNQDSSVVTARSWVVAGAMVSIFGRNETYFSIPNEVFLYSRKSKPSLGYNQHPVKLVLGTLPLK